MQYSEAMKIIVVLGLVLVVMALASAGVFMLKRPGRAVEGKPHADDRMAKALALRVAVSIALFALVLLSWLMGWIHPGGLPIGH
jgi:uncharacterized BrkB/YihY/UPF0761 family membrane protein